MTPFWSAWIMFLVVLNLGITLFLFLWGQRVAIPTLADGTSGHVWAHGVLKEGIRKLPLWWVLISLAMFITGFTYLALYPGFGSFKGMLGWTAHGELATDLAANRSKLDPLLQRVAVQPVEIIARDAEATLVGQRLFIDNCAACHGNEGHGNHLVGAPNLIDGDWLYGGSGDAILASIQDGRMGVMPPMGASFDAATVDNLANYVLSLSVADHWPSKAAAGQARDHDFFALPRAAVQGLHARRLICRYPGHFISVNRGSAASTAKTLKPSVVTAYIPTI